MDKSYINHVTELFEKDEEFCKEIAYYIKDLDNSFDVFISWNPVVYGPRIGLKNDKGYKILIKPKLIYIAYEEIVVSKYSYNDLKDIIKDRVLNIGNYMWDNINKEKDIISVRINR